MRRQILFVQGGGEGTHEEWDNKLVDSLGRELGPDYEIHYPRMPNEAEPEYAPWKAALGEELAKLNEGAILVGHSIGGAILISALAADPPEIALGGVFLIAAPFLGDGGWPSEDIKAQKDLGAALPQGIPIYLYHGSRDEIVPMAHCDLYAKAIPQAVTRHLKDRNHQLDDDLSEVARDIRSSPRGNVDST
ncbi:MAG TPA: alpha/beta fold hydrolase [Devosiaceae bacterium]|nr:alpha/beta fold hydrolase [Devosiaceae bacterium]